MRTMKGPAIFLAQFAGDAAAFNTMPAIARLAAGHGYKGVQLPSWDARLFDLERSAESKDYCEFPLKRGREGRTDQGLARSDFR